MVRKKFKKIKSKKAFKVKLKPATIYSVVQIAFYTLAGLIIVSFTRRGLVLVKLNDLLIELFAWTTIFLPFICISFGLLVSKLRIPLSQPNVMVEVVLFFIS